MALPRNNTILLLLSGILMSSMALALDSRAEARGVEWRSWGDGVFEQAKVERKLVLLNLQAAWCHWCHVMDAETYSRSDVQQLLAQSFIPVAVQQDSHPGLSARFRDSGWPATVVFNASGDELTVLSGFVEADSFIEILKGILSSDSKSPTPQPQPASKNASAAVLDKLRERYTSSLDTSRGGLNTSHRYLDSDSIEYALRRGLRGDRMSLEWLKTTLVANRALHDPVWGGVYQYSTGRQWGRPHYEKLLSSQVTNVQAYSLASSVFPQEGFQRDVEEVVRFVHRFLKSTAGPFYVSQAADFRQELLGAKYYGLSAEDREKVGAPLVDTHEYGREAGLGIEMMLNAYVTTGNVTFLNEARASAKWVVDNRMLPSGAIAHESLLTEEVFLADCIPVARALLRLSLVTGDKAYLLHSTKVLDFITQNFQIATSSGFVTSHSLTKNIGPSLKITKYAALVENIALARTANFAFSVTGNKAYKVAAERAFSFTLLPEKAFDSISEPGVLLLAEELHRGPIHITVVGPKESDVAELLWMTALRTPESYLHVERLTFADLESDEVRGISQIRYPKVKKPSAFLCANGTCSLPLFTPESLREKVVQVLRNGKE